MGFCIKMAWHGMSVLWCEHVLVRHTAWYDMHAAQVELRILETLDLKVKHD